MGASDEVRIENDLEWIRSVKHRELVEAEVQGSIDLMIGVHKGFLKLKKTLDWNKKDSATLDYVDRILYFCISDMIHRQVETDYMNLKWGAKDDEEPDERGSEL